MVNSPVLQSEIGSALMTKAAPETHFALIWSFVPEKNETWGSLRTYRPDADLSVLSRHIVGTKSGGGHPLAAGCAIGGNRIHGVARFTQKRA